MSDTDAREQSRVARTVLVIGGGGIVLLLVLAGIAEVFLTINLTTSAMKITPENRESYVMIEKLLTNIVNLTLPLLGVWVGAVVAYYFGKANFDAASKSIQNAYQYANPKEEILSRKLVSEEMRKNDEKLFKIGAAWTSQEAVTKEKEWEDKYLEEVYRLPVLDAGMKIPIGYLETNDIQLYINEKVKSGSETADAVKANTKIGEIVENSTIAKSSFALISKNATMKDASCLLTNPGVCILYVTENGKKGEELLGILIAKDVARCLSK